METGPCFIVSSDKLEKPGIKLQHLVYKTSDILLSRNVPDNLIFANIHEFAAL